MASDEQANDPAARRRRWRRIRTSVTLFVLIGVVVGGAWFSWRNVMGTADETQSTDSGCAPGAPTAAPSPGDVEVNVYNSTGRAGLAASTAEQMRERGFAVLEVENDPLDKDIEEPAEVRSGADQQPAANLVASLVPGSVYVSDDRTGTSVDLVLGEGFESLAPDSSPPSTEPDLPPCETGEPAEN